MSGWKGVAADVLDEAGVRLERGTVRVPYRDRDGRELYRKRFGSDGRSWYEPKGVELVPFGLETLPPDDSDVRSILQRDPGGLDPFLDEADVNARLSAALALSPDLDTFRRLLAGREEHPQ